jgi:para-nitrobenzyl esterase
MSSDRRAFVKQLCTGSVALGVARVGAGTAAANAAEGPTRGSDVVVLSKGNPVVRTSNGPVRGYVRNGVHTFKGIPYGASTAGKNRFMPPVRPEAWTAVKDTVAYGFACHQIHGNDWDDSRQHFVMNFDFGLMSEDCLSLNVWTPGVGDGKKRPVMVWIHGGGFQNGSSFELACYDGENLCMRGDVVVVSVNHRLNALGYLNLATVGGAAYASSANVGMLDLVAALEWVRENVEGFGGDKGNVTIFGQSGGGAKVNVLMAMPRAKGLFHKAIVQSGSMRMMGEPEKTARVGEELVRQLGIGPGQLEKLQALPYGELMAAARAAADRIPRESPRRPGRPAMPGLAWMPTADGTIVAGAPFVPGGPRLDGDVPLLVGCTLNEVSPSAYDEALESLTAEDLAARVAKTYGDKSAALIDAYKREYPRARPIDILSMVESLWMGGGSLTQAGEKADQGGAPAYAYRFDWKSDICDGRLRAFHALDMAFTFDNTARWESATGGGARAQRLAARMSQAWIDFARTGDPGHRDLPEWPRYQRTSGAVMIFDDHCQVRNHPDAEIRKIVYGS